MLYLVLDSEGKEVKTVKTVKAARLAAKLNKGSYKKIETPEKVEKPKQPKKTTKVEQPKQPKKTTKVEQPKTPKNQPEKVEKVIDKTPKENKYAKTAKSIGIEIGGIVIHKTHGEGIVLDLKKAPKKAKFEFYLLVNFNGVVRGVSTHLVQIKK